MRYLAILLTCASVWVLSPLMPVADSGWFFVVQSTWSLAIIGVVMAIEISKLTITICTIELLAMLLHLLACAGYVTSFDFFYINYTVALGAINTVEVAALLIGAPWDGLVTRLSNAWMDLASDHSTTDGAL